MDFENLVIQKLEKIEEKQDKAQSDINDVKVEQAKQSGYIEQNTSDLTEHKEGVIQNRTRITTLEDKMQPLTVKQLLKKIVLIASGVGAIAGSAIAIYKLMNL